jgi:hypothetical protein
MQKTFDLIQQPFAPGVDEMPGPLNVYLLLAKGGL